MKYQIRVAATDVLVEPSTYYPTRKVAEERIPQIEREVPNLKWKLVAR